MSPKPCSVSAAGIALVWPCCRPKATVLIVPSPAAGHGHPPEKGCSVSSRWRKIPLDREKCAYGATDTTIPIPGLAKDDGYSISKFPCVAAHLCLPMRGAWSRCQEPERDAWSYRCPHDTPGLCSLVLGAQNAGNSEYLLPCTGVGPGLFAVTVPVRSSGSTPIPAAFDDSIANGINLRKTIASHSHKVHYKFIILFGMLSSIRLLRRYVIKVVSPLGRHHFFTAMGAECRSP